MDKHLSILCKKHLETKFVKVRKEGRSGFRLSPMAQSVGSTTKD